MVKVTTTTKDSKVKKGTLVAVYADCGYRDLDFYFSSLPGALREGESLAKGALDDVNASADLRKIGMVAWQQYAEKLRGLDSIEDLAEAEIAQYCWAINIEGKLVTNGKNALYRIRIGTTTLFE